MGCGSLLGSPGENSCKLSCVDSCEEGYEDPPGHKEDSVYATSRVQPRSLIKVDILYNLKGTVSRDFRRQVFFMNQFPPSP
jgi:hypothetical protein